MDDLETWTPDRRLLRNCCSSCLRYCSAFLADQTAVSWFAGRVSLDRIEARSQISTSPVNQRWVMWQNSPGKVATSHHHKLISFCWSRCDCFSVFPEATLQAIHEVSKLHIDRKNYFIRPKNHVLMGAKVGNVPNKLQQVVQKKLGAAWVHKGTICPQIPCPWFHCPKTAPSICYHFLRILWCSIKMRAAFPASILPRVMQEGESKEGSSHFDEKLSIR